MVTRLSPATAWRQIALLYDMDCDVIDAPEVYLTACELSLDLGHRLFDTLYHAVALHLAGATLVTADEQHCRKARSRGALSLLSTCYLPD